MAYIYKTGRVALREQIRKHAHMVHGRALDVGGGSFARYKDLFRTHEYLTMDIAPGKNVDVVGKIETIPFPENSFDSIICTQVLGDVYDLGKAFAEMYRVLRPGGVALITESLFDPLHDEPSDFWRLTEHSLRRLGTDAHFEIVTIERRGGYWSTLAQLKARYWIERLNATKKWYARPLSLYLRITGSCARFLDARDQSRAAKLFTNGYLLIARKKQTG